MPFVQTEYKGYDTKAMKNFYDSHFNQAKEFHWSDEKADEYAKMMVDYYKHQFRSYK